ncbi:hypothetical protein ElyMa_003017300 [Elysia marginata]|uniref:Uncharacterized protein n=1 Tax=Elysia marginata TaxID=1093978 RepID=A0AAV4IIN0_9GAST|nr:hypothetical protein ElyMa_003017300 [Elysia marginata]
MLAWCVMVVSILSSSVKGSPTVTLLENKTTTFCDNFQLSGQDYTQLKYYISGANSNYQLGAFTAPKLIGLPTENIICSLLDSRTGNCTRTQECWCEEISPGEYHLTYNKTADADTSNATVVMQWSGIGDPVRSDTYTFHEVSTDENLCRKYHLYFHSFSYRPNFKSKTFCLSFVPSKHYPRPTVSSGVIGRAVDRYLRGPEFDPQSALKFICSPVPTQHLMGS